MWGAIAKPWQKSSGGGLTAKSAVFRQEGGILEWRWAVTRDFLNCLFSTNDCLAQYFTFFLSNALVTVFASLKEGEGNVKM